MIFASILFRTPTWWFGSSSGWRSSPVQGVHCSSTKAGRGSGTKMCWNRPSRPTTSQLTSGKPWPRPGWPGGQLYARAQSTLWEADYRAWMIRDRQGRTECQTLALLYLVGSAARSALPLSGSKLICANTSTDASSSKSKDYYYLGLLQNVLYNYLFMLANTLVVYLIQFLCLWLQGNIALGISLAYCLNVDT